MKEALMIPRDWREERDDIVEPIRRRDHRQRPSHLSSSNRRPLLPRAECLATTPEHVVLPPYGIKVALDGEGLVRSR
ncbi:hypothetical protein BST61_g11366 [Cercospora zeina]